MDRRNFLTKGIAATTAFAAMAQSAKATESKSVKIIGISCSSRKGKTTATAVNTALEAAKKVSPQIEVQLIDLAGLKISGWIGGATPSSPQEILDDFQVEVEPYFMSYNLGGLIIGSPSYFRTMSSQCKALLERLYVLREPKLLLADKPVGVLSVGSFRNGGQELVIEQIQAAMLCHEVMLVGGKPKAHQGATLWNRDTYNDDITKDEFGMETAKNLGIRVAEAALLLSKKSN
ncbi:MAG: flavodoxin family protein [Sedimentisphaerales bacterium]|nr:flavodoxin family protein [Sedimentisphaerales bacterium]